MSSRTFVAHSPLGEQLEFRSMEGTEQISRLFQFRVRLLSDSPSLSTGFVAQIRAAAVVGSDDE